MYNEKPKYVVKRAGSNDELAHANFKYIDKIKLPNGKWRYIYTKAQSTANKVAGTANAIGNKAYSKLGGAQQKTMNKLGREYSRLSDSAQEATARAKRLNRSNASSDALRRQAAKAHDLHAYANKKGKEYVKAQSEFMKTPLGVATQIGSAVKKAVDAGRNFLSNLFGKKKSGAVQGQSQHNYTVDSPKKKTVRKKTNTPQANPATASDFRMNRNGGKAETEYDRIRNRRNNRRNTYV